jgi:hypothetical protein
VSSYATNYPNPRLQTVYFLCDAKARWFNQCKHMSRSPRTPNMVLPAADKASEQNISDSGSNGRVLQHRDATPCQTELCLLWASNLLQETIASNEHGTERVRT